MTEDLAHIRARVRRLERQIRDLETGSLDWLAYVPRETFAGPWPEGAGPSASRLLRELKTLTEQAASHGPES